MFHVHTYFTNGMTPLAETFVESFALFHKYYQYPPILLHIDAYEIPRITVKWIKSIYPSVIIHKHSYPFDFWSEKCDISIIELVQYKKQVECQFVTNKNRIWKLITAGDDRIKKIKEVLTSSAVDENDIIFHFDIDTLFRGPIISTYNRARQINNLIGLKFRLNHKVVKAKITIDFMSFKKDDFTLSWINDWLKIIDEVPPKKRPVGFGQASCFKAYEQAVAVRSDAFWTIPKRYGLPGDNKRDNVVWCGNIHGLPKEDCAKMFKKEIERIKIKKQIGGI